MAVTHIWMGQSALGQFHATAARRVNWVGDTIKVSLHLAALTVTQDTTDFYDDITDEVATGNGYTTGGETLASKTLTYDGASNTVRLDAADVVWTFTGSKTMRYAVIRADTGTPSTSPVMSVVNFGADESSSGTFTLQWDATDGVLRAVVGT